MTEDAELQARIAAIAGQINQHKQQQQPAFSPSPQYRQPPHHIPDIRHARGRWSPYARGGRGAFMQPHKNRTLILSATSNSPRATEAADPNNATMTDPSTTAESYVSTQGPGRKQLMNQNTYQREQKQLLEQKDHARVAKRQKIDREERNSLMHHVNASPGSGNRELVVDGIRFQLRDDGSKLTRIRGESTSGLHYSDDECELSDADASSSNKETRKKVKIADVDFYRTKNGNFIRANAVRDLLRPVNRKVTSQCEHFTKHGNCPFGPICKFSHDPDKVAVCKTFLRTGSCAAGDSCDLSHITSYHRVPACAHFLRGNCTKEACPYPHIHVSSSAPVCRAFAFLGYCSSGEDCTKRHVVECPDYANSGFCANRESGKCPLPHPDRASTLRKAAARQAKTGSEDESDVTSDEEMQDDTGLEDIDSDEAEDFMGDGMDHDHALTQQQDFIAFS